MVKPNEAKAPEIKKSKRNLRCVFTDREMLAVGKLLAEKNTELVALENDKKRVTSDFSAKVQAAQAEISVLTNKITSGYEFRMVPCLERLGAPEPGRKEVYREDTGELVAAEDMTPGELQRQLEIVVPVKPAAA